MTVQDLIRRLVQFDPDLLVAMPGEDMDWVEVASVFEDLMSHTKEGNLGLSDEMESDYFRVVRLFGPDDR